MRFRSRIATVRPWLLAACAAGAPGAVAQDPPRLFQDELDLLVRASVVQGSGARAFGMGAAFLARADDGTAASWNPAGLSYLRRPETSFVWTQANLDSEVYGTLEGTPGLRVEDNHRHSESPDFIALAHPFSFREIQGAAQISYQRVVSFDTRRRVATPAAIGRLIEAESSGGFDVLALGTGVQVLPALRVGLAVNRWTNGYSQSLTRLTRAVDSQQESNFKLKGWNVHAGVIWSVSNRFNLGAVVKTPFTARASLSRSRVDTLDEGDVVPNSYERTDLEIDWPGAAGLGASWRPKSALTISIDYTRARWSKSRIRNFFTLERCSSVCGDPSPDDQFPDLPYPTLNDERQRDTEEFRGGLEYVIIRNRVKWPLRAGLFTDRQYFNQFAAGPPSFRGVTAGAGIIVGPLLLDAAWVFEWGRYTALDGNSGESTVRVASRRFLISAIYRQSGR